MTAEDFDVAEARIVAAARKALWPDKSLRAQVMPRHPWAWTARVACGWSHNGTLRVLTAEAETPEAAVDALLEKIASPLDARWPLAGTPTHPARLAAGSLRADAYALVAQGVCPEAVLAHIGDGDRPHMRAALAKADAPVLLG